VDRRCYAFALVNAVYRAALVIRPHDLKAVRVGEDHEPSAQVARALVGLDDRQSRRTASLDRALHWILAGHATHQNPISWLWPTTPSQNSSASPIFRGW
jgi:hypothetical protein